MNALKTYEKLSGLPFGKYIFSRLFCLKAPYFGTIKPHFAQLRKGLCVVEIKKRRRVQNHIGTVHAIAMCNMAEAAAGLCVEASISDGLRWIPKKMEVEYIKKAQTNLKAVCEFDPKVLVAGEVPVEVKVTDTNNEPVFRAKIVMYLSPRKINA